MKKIIHFNIKNANRVIVGILSLLGFSFGCEMGDEAFTDNAFNDYETPAAIYTVKGKVTTQNAAPVEHIRIIASHPNSFTRSGMNTDTLYTDGNGDFVWKERLYPKEQNVKFIAEDIDGEANLGFFQTDSAEVKFSLTDFDGGDGIWNQGEAVKEIHFKLRKKADQTS